MNYHDAILACCTFVAISEVFIPMAFNDCPNARAIGGVIIRQSFVLAHTHLFTAWLFKTILHIHSIGFYAQSDDQDPKV